MKDYDYTELIKSMQKNESEKLITILEFEEEKEKDLEAEMNAYQNLLIRLNTQQNMNELNYQRLKAENEKKSQKHMNNPLNHCIVL